MASKAIKVVTWATKVVVKEVNKANKVTKAVAAKAATWAIKVAPAKLVANKVVKVVSVQAARIKVLAAEIKADSKVTANDCC